MSFCGVLPAHFPLVWRWGIWFVLVTRLALCCWCFVCSVSSDRGILFCSWHRSCNGGCRCWHVGWFTGLLQQGPRFCHLTRSPEVGMTHWLNRCTRGLLAWRGNRPRCRATTFWVASRSRQSLLLWCHAMLHCALNVYNIVQCCIALSVFGVRVVKVVCDCVLSHTFRYTSITVNSCCDGNYALLHCTLSVLKQVVAKIDSCCCGIMQCCIVLWVFKAIVAKAVCHCILLYALCHIAVTVSSCYCGIMQRCIVL